MSGPTGEFVPDRPCTPFAALRAATDELPAPLAQDPIEAARRQGEAEGYAQARAAFELERKADAAALERLTRHLDEFRAIDGARLSERLREIVCSLCEAALAPLALDADALTRRIEAAVTLLARADDAPLLRLNPADLAMLEGRLPHGLRVQADQTLERGALRIETDGGGVEDGPAQWRLAIAEAVSAL